jgi:hypothetical protein
LRSQVVVDLVVGEPVQREVRENLARLEPTTNLADEVGVPSRPRRLLGGGKLSNLERRRPEVGSVPTLRVESLALEAEHEGLHRLAEDGPGGRSANVTVAAKVEDDGSGGEDDGGKEEGEPEL